MIEMLSTRCPVRVRMLKPNRIMVPRAGPPCAYRRMSAREALAMQDAFRASPAPDARLADRPCPAMRTDDDERGDPRRTARHGASRRSPPKPARSPWRAACRRPSTASTCRTGVVCVKRALSRLKVAAEWHAPVERNRYEAEWMRVAGEHRARMRPSPARRGARGSGRSRWSTCRPTSYPVWKALLRDGGTTAGRRDRASRRRWAASTRAPPIARTSRRAFRRTRSSRRSASSPTCSRRRRRIPTCAGRLHALAATTAQPPARAGPRRLQPEEPPDRARRTGDPRRRMRLVSATRRSTSRSCSTTCC